MWSAAFASSCADSLSEDTRELLWLRGVSDEQIAQFQVGYIDGFLPEGDYPEAFLKWSGGGSKLVNSFVLPLTNWLGEVKGFQFRSADRSVGGYMDFFLDYKEPVFFGLGQAAPFVWSTGEVCVVEGAFDLFPVHRVLPNTISTLTAKVTLQLIRSLRRLVDRVYVFYDNDSAGIKASAKFAETYGPVLDIRRIEYPIGVLMSNGHKVKDPNDLWEVLGDHKLADHLRLQMR